MFTEENKTMENAVENAVDIVEATASKSGIGVAAGFALAVGVGAVAGFSAYCVVAGVKALAKHLPKKEVRKPETPVEPTDDQVRDAAAK